MPIFELSYGFLKFASKTIFIIMIMIILRKLKTKTFSLKSASLILKRIERGLFLKKEYQNWTIHKEIISIRMVKKAKYLIFLKSQTNKRIIRISWAECIGLLYIF